MLRLANPVNKWVPVERLRSSGRENGTIQLHLAKIGGRLLESESFEKCVPLREKERERKREVYNVCRIEDLKLWRRRRHL